MMRCVKKKLSKYTVLRRAKDNKNIHRLQRARRLESQEILSTDTLRKHAVSLDAIVSF